MGLDIYFVEDIRNALLAANEASTSTARVCAAMGGDQIALRAYLEGYQAALATVALAFGLSPTIIGYRETLEVLETSRVWMATLTETPVITGVLISFTFRLAFLCQ